MWGCDSETEDRAWFAECVACAGEGFIVSGGGAPYDSPEVARCEACEGSGELSFYRCPSKVLGEGRVAEAVPAALAFFTRGEWPDPGPLAEQSAWFVDLVNVMGAERARIEVARMKRMRKPGVGVR